MLVSLFAEAQRNAILSGKEELTPAMFEATFKDNFSTMTQYIESDKIKVPVKKEAVEVRESETISVDEKYLLYRTRERSGKDFNKFISSLKDYINVEYIKL